MPFADPPAVLQATIAALRKAQTLFAEGHYSECVANCRKAIEGLATQQARDTDWNSKAIQRLTGIRKTMTKEERELVVEATVYNFASLPPHDASVEINRRDAKLAITLAAGIVAHSMG